MEVMPEIKQQSVAFPAISESDTTHMNGGDHDGSINGEKAAQKEEETQKASIAPENAENAQAAMPKKNASGAGNAGTKVEEVDEHIPAVTPPNMEAGVAHPVATLDETLATDVESPDAQKPETHNSGGHSSVTDTAEKKQRDVDAASGGMTDVNPTVTSMNEPAEQSSALEVSSADLPLANGVKSSTNGQVTTGSGEPNGRTRSESVSDAQIDSIVAEMMDETFAEPTIASQNDDGGQNPEMAAGGQAAMDIDNGLQEEKPPAVATGVEPTTKISEEGSQGLEGSAKSSSSTSSASAEVIDLLDSDDDEDSNANAAAQPSGAPAAKRQRREGSPVSAALSAVAHIPNPAMQQQNHVAPTYQAALDPFRNPIYIAPSSGFTPTWKHLVPNRTPQHHPNQNKTKSYQLSLLNVAEFTITGLRVGDEYTGHMTSLSGLRGPIKKIARDHGNAFFERDPDGEGKWHIPLGAYHALYGFLHNDPLVVHLDGISETQLKIASLGKARLEKEFPSSRKLVKYGVPKKLADTLAPFQRGGVDFVIEKEGRALIADEMGLGKTIQGIASMAVYHEEWPILVLCPSSARYHWESEFRNWLGQDSTIAEHAGAFEAESKENESEEEDDDLREPRLPMPPLQNYQINVLTSGQDALFPHVSTKVVICSYGLAPNLVNSGKLLPGMIQCAIVDESHMLKNKNTQRTKTLLPVLKATSRCVLLSGTPAFARPMELWPQLDILGCKRHGWWQDEAEFTRKYARGNKQRRAELHTMLMGTVMIRRMKHEILKTLPVKVREQGVVDVMDDNMRREMKACMATLKSGKGKLSELARNNEMEEEEPPETQLPTNSVTATAPSQAELAAAAVQYLEQDIEQRRAYGRGTIQQTLASQSADPASKSAFAREMERRLEDQLRAYRQQQTQTIAREIAAGTYTAPAGMAPLSNTPPQPDPSSEKKLVLNHMYTLTGKSKIPIVVEMLKRWLDDPTKGKLCIFAHHISVLDELISGAGLSNAGDSMTKYIRIDGSTTPRSRQDQINTFQRDSSVRIAILGITAAGVAVTLTAASTVWFAELFWTPAIMVQAEDRCHRIGQQAQVKCLYFVAKGTLDELLWKLLENKFQALGEFVEGKEKMKIVVNNTYHSSHELIKAVSPDTEEDNLSDANSECSLSDVQEISSDLEHEIEELGLSEQKLLATEDNDESDPVILAEPDAKPAAKVAGTSVDEAICLSDDDDEVEEVPPAQANSQEEASSAGDAAVSQQAVATKLPAFNLSTASFPELRIYRLYFAGASAYGLNFSFFAGRMVVSGVDPARVQEFGPQAKPHPGDVLVGINRGIVPVLPSMSPALQALKTEKDKGTVELMFAEDPTITSHIMEALRRERERREEARRVMAEAQQAAAASAHAAVQKNASDDIIEID